MSYICERCNKVVEDDQKFGSGRFCSRSCANSHKHSDEWKNNIRNGILKYTECYCKYCGKEFNNLTQKASHERLCDKNPDRKPQKPNINHEKKLKRLYKLNKDAELNVTYEYILNYLDTHKTCEICGRCIEDVNKWDSKYAPKRLCVDHDHNTNRFRGVLCSVCNRQLGWYEANEESIKKYLQKSKNI